MAHPLPQSGPAVQYAPEDEALFTKVSWRLMPLLITCYVIAFLDRVNIGFAQLQMKQTLPFTDAAYALGAGVFFVGYFLCEVPSNLLLEKIGARKTMLRIMLLWGICASAMMYVSSTTMFYVLRFLLGALEAGFFPGIILYLTYWFPAARRAKMIAMFMTGATIAYLLAGPISGAIMKYMDGFLGHYGWQWLFVTQGLPASFMGIAAFLYLQDKPDDAKWLSASEKTRLNQLIAEGAQQAGGGASHGSFWELFRDVKVMVMCGVYFLQMGATYIMVFWTPTLIKGWGVKDVFTVGLLSAVGPLAALFGMLLIGRSSDRSMERRRHFMFCCVLCALGALGAAFTQGNIVASLISLAVLTVGQSSSTPIFFAALSDYLPKKTAAGGIALVSSLGNLGPAVFPSIVTWLVAQTGAPTMGLYMVVALWLMAGVILMSVVRPAAQPMPLRAVAA
ncbi:MAG: MFS transporter [Acidovorax sp.]